MERKKCSKCRRVKPLDDFGPEKRSPDGRRYSCRKCDRERHNRYRQANREARNIKARERRRVNPELDREYQRRYRERFVWRRLFQHAKKRAAKFGWPFDLGKNLEAFKARVEPMRCELTGVPLLPGVGAGSQGKRFWNTASIDRKDRTKGYTLDNIRIVCWAMNCALGTWGETVLLDIMRRWINRGE